MVFLIGNWNTKWKLIIHYIKVSKLEDCEEIMVDGQNKDGSFYSEICPKIEEEKVRVFGFIG